MSNALVLAIIVGVGILMLLLGLIAIYIMNKNRGQKREPDYRVFFILGISFLPIGIATDNPGMWGVGAVFLLLGLANRGRWKEEPKWSEVDPEKRKTTILIILGLTVLLLLGLAFYLLEKYNVFG